MFSPSCHFKGKVTDSHPVDVVLKFEGGADIATRLGPMFIGQNFGTFQVPKDFEFSKTLDLFEVKQDFRFSKLWNFSSCERFFGFETLELFQVSQDFGISETFLGLFQEAKDFVLFKTLEPKG